MGDSSFDFRGDSSHCFPINVRGDINEKSEEEEDVGAYLDNTMTQLC